MDKETHAKWFAGDNDISNWLQSRFGKRFFIIRDNINQYIGLFDFNFLRYCVMNNCMAEKEECLEIIREAHGDVLIAGLGIGLIVLPIMNKNSVTSVDIVERHKEVIDLIGSQLPFNDKVKIINEDIARFISSKKYTTIYLDTIPEALHLEEEKESRMIDGKFITDFDMVEEFRPYLKEDGKILTYERRVRSG